MKFKILGFIFAAFPFFSWAHTSNEELQVYIERDGILYKIADKKQLEELIKFADLKEVESEELDEVDMAGGFTESGDGDDDTGIIQYQ